MKIRLNKRYLDDNLEGLFYLNIEPYRVAYVPKGDRGLPEYILVYNFNLPTSELEPELFGIPHERDSKLEETWLKYKLATVILISKKADDKFRTENENLINMAEALYIE